MRKIFISLSLVLMAFLSRAQTVESWITTAGGEMLLEKDRPTEFQAKPEGRRVPIVVDSRQTYQSMEGFGFALTGGSAELLMKMTPKARKNIPWSLEVSLLKLSILDNISVKLSAPNI